jgi:ABC-type phosphate transport system substrate-binding protein
MNTAIMKISTLLFGATLSACLVPAVAFAGGIVVIVNKANDNAIDKALVAKIYQGDSRTWPNGGSIAALDLPEDNSSRSDFDAAIVGKGQGALKSLWAQNVFTGKALPPKTAASDEDVKKAVAANKNAIGYIQSGSADDTVKVVVRQ